MSIQNHVDDTVPSDLEDDTSPQVNRKRSHTDSDDEHCTKIARLEFTDKELLDMPDPSVAPKIEAASVIPEEEFNLVIDMTQTFRSLLEVLVNIVPCCRFEIVKNDTFEGIAVDEYDLNKVMVVSARMKCVVRKCLSEDMQVSSDQNSFCVNVSILKRLMALIPPTCKLEIRRRLGDVKVFFNAYEPHRRDVTRSFLMDCRDKEPRDWSIPDIDEKYIVEIDMKELRTSITTYQHLNNDEVTFIVKECKKPGPLRQTVFIITALCDESEIVYKYESVTEWQSAERDPNNERIVIKAFDTDMSASNKVNFPHHINDMVETYTGNFSTKYIGHCLKSMENHPLRMMMAPNKPLIVFYELGEDKSYVRFLLTTKEPSE